MTFQVCHSRHRASDPSLQLAGFSGPNPLARNHVCPLQSTPNPSPSPSLLCSMPVPSALGCQLACCKRCPQSSPCLRLSHCGLPRTTARVPHSRSGPDAPLPRPVLAPQPTRFEAASLCWHAGPPWSPGLHTLHKHTLPSHSCPPSPSPLTFSRVR